MPFRRRHFQVHFRNENVWIPIKNSLKFVPKDPIDIPSLVQIMAWRRLGDKPLSEPMMVSLPTHICVTWLQRVKMLDAKNTIFSPEAFNDQDSENCTCPVPCDKRMFDPIITYASNSNFDMDIMLRGDTDELQSKYIRGRENHFLSMMTSSNGNIFRVTGPLCGEFTGPGEFPAQRPVTRSFDVFFDLRLNKRLSKQPWGWWFETPSWSLWCQCNAIYVFIPSVVFYVTSFLIGQDLDQL